MADESKESSSDVAQKEQTGNKFVNDGSFMELFKKKMEQQKSLSSNTDDSCSVKYESAESLQTESDIHSASGKSNKTNMSSLVGKRRSGGAKALKTGIVKKPKSEEDNETDGLSSYMAEVHKYKAKICMDEDKTRPLVK